MAITKNILTSNTKGSIDNLVIVRRLGQTFYRRKPKHYHDAKTKNQLKSRTRLTAANEPLKPLAKYARFKYRKPGQTQRNALMKRVMADATAYKHNNWMILPEKITISSGGLPPVNNLTVASAKNHMIKIAWVDNSGYGDAKSNDEMFIIFYNPLCENNQVVEASIKSAHRSDSLCSKKVPANWSGQTVYIYVYTVSYNTLFISDSKCLTATAF